MPVQQLPTAKESNSILCTLCVPLSHCSVARHNVPQCVMNTMCHSWTKMSSTGKWNIKGEEEKYALCTIDFSKLCNVVPQPQLLWASTDPCSRQHPPPSRLWQIDILGNNLKFYTRSRMMISDTIQIFTTALCLPATMSNWTSCNRVENG